jgi:hypothetical protein
MATQPPQRKNALQFLKGAFVEAPGDDTGVLNPIYFQFNPETVERTKSGTWTSAQSQRQKADDAAVNNSFQNFKGKKVKAGYVPSPEKISLTLRLDSREKLFRAASAATADVSLGLLPELSALESLMNKVTIKDAVEGSKNSPTLVRTKQIPLVLFLWGGFRVIPVTILSMTITEQQFDRLLNPVRAEIKVSLQVLEEEDAKLNSLASESFRFTENEKKKMKENFFKNQRKANEGIVVPGGYPEKLMAAQKNEE